MFQAITNPDPDETFWAQLRSAGSCWEWTGSLRGPYGRWLHQGGQYAVHRVSYQYLVGHIPEGLVLDHLCLNKVCVNPAHLDPCPHGENSRRGNGQPAVNARKRECASGHPFTPENTSLVKGERRCRTCRRLRQRKYRAARRAV